VSRSVTETIYLAAPPRRVWETVMDPTQLGRWVTTHDSVADAPSGPVREGDSFIQKLRLAGKSFAVDWTVVEADEPNVARWEGQGPGGSHARVSYRLSSEDGGTRFDYRSEFALPGGALGKIAGGLLAAAPGKREASRSLERLRALLENGQGASTDQAD
jgi:uncharacterized protein YndB with AHSA1/START domain